MSKTNDEILAHLLEEIIPGDTYEIKVKRWVRHLECLAAQYVDKNHDVHINDWYFEEGEQFVDKLACYREDELVVLRQPIEVRRYAESSTTAFDLLNSLLGRLQGIESWNIQQKQTATFSVTIIFWAKMSKLTVEASHSDIGIACLLAVLKAYQIDYPVEPKAY